MNSRGRGETCLPAGRWYTRSLINVFYVYIFKSERTGEFYKGLTSSLEKRLKEHLIGKNKSTKNMLPIKLVHVELCNNRLEARKLEKFFKSGYGREIINEIESINTCICGRGEMVYTQP